MSVTIDDLLSLAGKLDDEPGYDAPRERFRRFLATHVTTSPLARHLIEQCQHAPTEQHHRALQDLVVLTGRFLGFEATFGSYEPLAGAVRYDGQWQSRSKLHVVVEVRRDHLMSPGVETLVRSVSALSAAFGGRGIKPAGLCVVVQPVTGRNRVEDAIAAAHAPFPLSTLGLRSLLLLADTISAGGLTHDDVIRMIDGSLPIDFVVGMIERAQGKTTPRPVEAAVSPTMPAPDGPHYWITVVGADHATRPEEFLELVVGRRQIYGITGSPASPHVVRPGDGLCFFISGRGVVGHARVGSIVENANVIRDAHRFRQLIHVDGVELHTNDPWTLDDESKLKMQAVGKQTLVQITREGFRALTVPRRLTTAEGQVDRESSIESQPSIEGQPSIDGSQSIKDASSTSASKRRR